ncbi:MAG: hypothetical protein WB392_03165 [Methanotrichaceae archaeon]
MRLVSLISIATAVIILGASLCAGQSSICELVLDHYNVTIDRMQGNTSIFEAPASQTHFEANDSYTFKGGFARAEVRMDVNFPAVVPIADSAENSNNLYNWTAKGEGTLDSKGLGMGRYGTFSFGGISETSPGGNGTENRKVTFANETQGTLRTKRFNGECEWLDASMDFITDLAGYLAIGCQFSDQIADVQITVTPAYKLVKHTSNGPAPNPETNTQVQGSPAPVGPSCSPPAPGSHLVRDQQYPSECVFKCEDGYQFNGTHDCVKIPANTPSAGSQQGLETSSGEKINPGDKNTMYPEDKIILGAKCREFVQLVKANMGGDQDFYKAIAVLAYIRSKGWLEEPAGWVSPSGNEVMVASPVFQQTMWDLLNCTYFCAKLYNENPQLLYTKSALSGPLSDTSSPAQIELRLDSGPFLAEVVNNEVSLSIDTATATVSSIGNNTFGVEYDLMNNTTYIIAYQRPVNIQPTNISLAPITLNGGQAIIVDSNQVSPAISIASIPLGGQGVTTGTAPVSGTSGVSGMGNATSASGSLSVPGGPVTSGPGTSTGGMVNQNLSNNNQIGDAAQISTGQSISQTITPAGSSNFYSFKVDNSGIVKLKLNDVPNDMRATLQLYDKNFNSIGYSQASNDGDEVSLEKGVQGPGWFYIQVQDADGKSHNEPYSLNISFEPAPDQYDPNPNFFRASEVKPGDTINAYICPSGESDFYKVFVNTSGIFKLKLEDVPDDMRATLQLYDKTFSSIGYSQASNAGDEVSLKKGVQGPGWFYIGVQDADGKAHSQPYALNIAFEPAPDQYDPNPNFFRASEITQGQSITGYICPSGESDFYKFYMGSSGTVKVSLDGVPADMRATLQLYDKTFSGIGYSQASNPGDKVSLVKDVQGPGWFYVGVQDADGKAHSQPYTLTVSM